MVYGINRFNTPGQKVPTAGEYRPMGMGNKGNTYIQVNNYGNGFGCCSSRRGWAPGAWANMGCEHHHHHEESTFGKIMGWSGIGLSGAGIILDWLGIGGNKGNNSQGNVSSQGNEGAQGGGAIQGGGQGTQANQNVTGNPDAQDAAAAQGDEAAQGGDAAQGGGNAQGNTDLANVNWPQEGQESEYETVVKDKSGRTQDIKGKMKVTKAGESGKAPKNFEVKTQAGFTYKFELVKDENGKTIYKCTHEIDPNGNSRAASGQEYECKLGADGNPIFNQESGMTGHGSGV